MKIGIPKEIMEGETRVAVIPAMLTILSKGDNQVLVESHAGEGASFSDSEYEAAGAKIMKNATDLYGQADLVIKLRAPQKNDAVGKHEVAMINEGSCLISSLPPRTHPQLLPLLVERKITAFGLEYIPRITKAQSMDVLSSMATVSGYKSVLVAAYHLGKFFPLLMTAAGTVPPATVLVLGAGVAGLQAIATAKRLGAKVEAFDPRPVVKEQVESLGGHFISMETEENVETKGGYAKEQSEDFLRREQDAIAERLPKVDAVISTAQIFGKRAPILITAKMVQLMRAGSIIIDLAVADGGNCESAKSDEVVEAHGVTIFGSTNIAASVPVHASQMHSKNVTNLFKHVFSESENGFDFDDEIVKGSCITHNGEIVNEMVKQNLK